MTRALLGLMILIAGSTGAATRARASPTAATAMERPSVVLAGRVTDAAHLLDAATTARLTLRLARFEAATGHQLVVVTVRSLGREDIAAFTLRLANAWGIGRALENDGVVVILLAPVERKVRIEVGRGLERALPDAWCHRVITDAMLPRFRRGDFGGGLEAGVGAIVRRLS